MAEQTLAELRAEILGRLPTAADVEAARAGRPISKGKTRLEQTIEARPLTTIDQKAFLAAVRKRDKDRCRCCGRKVAYVIARVPERGEVHHIHGRAGDLRFEAKAALLLCLRDHERCTGKVNDKLAIVASKTFTVRGQICTDARYPVKFVRVV